jgi:hypothetical protein
MTGRLFLISTLATALATAAPAWKGEISSPALGTHPPLKPVALDFQLSWKGLIHSGKVRMEFGSPASQKPNAFTITANGGSQGAAAAIYPFQFQFRSDLNPTNLRPRSFHAVETDAKETETTSVRYLNDRTESHRVTRELTTGKETTKIETFAHAPVFDIFSAMLHIRSQKLAPGDSITLVIQPFNNPYLLRVKCIGREIHNEQKTIRLTVGMQKIDRKTGELRAYKKLKKDATLWLSDDSDRVPVEIRAAAFIGDVRATLVQRQLF